MLKLAELSQRTATIVEKARKVFSDADINFSIPERKKETIRLVFAGQYSAGKSTILKMLTGRTDIAVGAGITTQKTHIYNWNGLEVIDTPGIHTELRPDHDAISYEAIASADMLVFVITNELFDSYIAEHFRKLAIDKDKAGEMILVVNKMERAADGNSISQRNIIREDLEKVLAPYTPEQLHISFLDAESYLDGLAEKSSDDGLAKDLIERSGYGEFIDTLNRFVDEKSIPSKLTTELYLIDGKIEQAISSLQPTSSDTDIDALEESFLQQRRLLIEARGELWQKVNNVFITAASKIRDLGGEAANLLTEDCNQDDVEEKLKQFMLQADEITESCQYEAVEVLDSRLNEVGLRLDNLENSEFTQNLKVRLIGKFNGLPERIKTILTKASPGLQTAGQKILSNAYKAGAQGGLKLTNFSGSTIHEMVKKIGHSIGYKFKPWQAIKLTKGIAIGGEVLSIFGVALNVFMQIKTDQDEEKIHKNLQNNRQNIRSQFNVVANELEDYAKHYIMDNVNRPLEASIAEIDENINGIRDSRLSRSQTCRNLEDLQKECRLLIQDIHSTNLDLLN